MERKDAMLATILAERLAIAEAHLWAQMESAGMHRRDGWSVMQLTRERDGGSEIVLRPMHMSIPAPPGFECVVWIGEDEDAEIRADCADGPVDFPRDRPGA